MTEESTSTQLNKDAKCMAWLVFWVCLIAYSYFFQSGQHNENVRFDLMRAIVEDGKMEITRFSHNSADVVVLGKKVFSGKAPGISFLGAPFWALWFKVCNSLISDASLAEHIACYLTCISVVALPAASLASLLFLVLARMGNLRNAFSLTMVFAIGTIAFPFSTLLFSHQLCSALLFIGFYIVYFHSSKSMIFLAGLLMGFAVATEYPAAIGAVWIGLYTLRKRGFLKGGLLLPLAGLFGILPLVIYNLSVFGKVLYTPYSVYAETTSEEFPIHKQGLLGISFPNYENYDLILTSLNRGLLVVNPIFILLALAVPLTFLIRRNLQEKIMAIGIILSYLYLNLSFGTGLVYAGGGCSVGPRHLIPMLPFAFFLFVDLMRWKAFRIPVYLLGFASCAIMLMATATEPRVPYEYDNPVIDLFWRGYIEGHLALETDGVFNSQLITENSIAFNLGKLFGLPSQFQLLPLFLIWGIFYFFLRKKFSKNDKDGIQFYDFSVYFFLLTLFMLPVYWNINNKPPSSDTGFAARYFETKIWENGCPLDLLEEPKLKVLPTIRKVDHKLTFEWLTKDFIDFISTNFNADWSATFNVEKKELYSFRSESDDGSCVYIDNKLIVDNWGEHARNSREGNVELDQGEHYLYIRYMSVASGPQLKVTWAKGEDPLNPLNASEFAPIHID